MHAWTGGPTSMNSGLRFLFIHLVRGGSLILRPRSFSSSNCRPQHQEPTSDEVGMNRTGSALYIPLGSSIKNPPLTRWVWLNGHATGRPQHQEPTSNEVGMQS